MEMFVYERLPCCKQLGSIVPHVLVNIHGFEAGEILILHQVSSMFNFRNMTTHSHKINKLRNFNNNNVVLPIKPDTSHLYFWSFNTKLM